MLPVVQVLRTLTTSSNRSTPARRAVFVLAVVTTATLTLASVSSVPVAAAPATVTIRLGQDLSMVAASNHTTVAALAAANGIADPNRVDAGTVLRLPGTMVAPVVSVTDGTPRTVVVRRGEDLTEIAARNHVTVAALAVANAITNTNDVEAGAVLRLPGPTPPPVAAPSTASGAPHTVVVRTGDDLTTIAARYDTTVAALAGANGITNTNDVDAGTVLRLPVSTMALASDTIPLPVVAAGAVGSVSLPAALLAHPNRLALLPVFKEAAAAAGVPASLLEAMCWWESGWQADVVSPTGAVGLCQIEPATAGFIQSVLLHGAKLDSLVTSQNIELAAAYLGYLLQQTGGKEQLALGAYYAGLSAVLKNGLSPATENYVTGITAYAAIFAAAS